MHVTQHAKRRFALRVCATAHPVHGVLDMWYEGKPATADDLILKGVRVEPGYCYRVCRHNNGPVMILVAAENAIVTILY